MKTKFVISFFTLLWVISLVVEACTMPDTPPLVPPTALANPAVTIDMFGPYDGSIYSVGELIYLNGIIKVAFDPSQVSETSFLVNGTSVAANTQSQTGNPNIVSDATWTASNPGEYYIQAKVMLSDGSSAISEPHRVCVMPIEAAILSDWSDRGGGRGYLGPCPLATRIPNPASTGNLVFNVVASPNVIRATRICSDVAQPLTPAITFIAHVDDPQDLVALVHVSILHPSGGLPLWNSYLNWITTRPTNQKEYRGTLQDPSNVLSRVDSARWQAIAYGRDGHQIQMVEGVITVQLIDCNQYPQPPTPTPTAAVLEVVPQVPMFIPPTFTLIMNAFCRSGPNMSFSDVTAFTAGETGDILNVSEDGFWYFVDWKKFDAKCWVAVRTGEASGDLTGLKILIVPTLSAPEPPPKSTAPPESEPALPPASGCSSYGDASSCTTNGCSWDKATNSCH